MITTKKSTWLISALYVICLTTISAVERPDANWDLLNYHFYVAHAFWTGRLDRDLAAAGLMSYTNPLIDMPYYLLQHVLNAPHLAAAVLGLLQALAFPLVWWVARMVLPRKTQDNYPLLAVFLALAGTLVPYSLCLLGTTAGDMITVPLVVESVCLVLKGWDRSKSLILILFAGLCLGVATGLKLTNAIYVVSLGLCVLLLRPAYFWTRLQNIVLLGVGTVAGFMPTGGWWMIHLYRTFGNPLFPLYSKYFPNPLTLPIGSMATGFGPRSIWQFITLPWVMAFNTKHAHVGNEEHFHVFLWPIFFTLLILVASSFFLRSKQKRAFQENGRRKELFIVAFVAFSFLIWAVQFSILRYLTPADALLPLAVYIVGNRLPVGRWRVRVGTLAVAFGALAMWINDSGRLTARGRGQWQTPAVSVDIPAIAAPNHTTVISVLLRPEWPSFSWMVPFFPEKLAFAMIPDTVPPDGSLPDFPASAAYFSAIHKMIKDRGGPVYAMVGKNFCPFWAKLPCTSDQMEPQQDNSEHAVHVLQKYGFSTEIERCKTYQSNFNGFIWNYRWCPVTDLMQ